MTTNPRMFKLEIKNGKSGTWNGCHNMLHRDRTSLAMGTFPTIWLWPAPSNDTLTSGMSILWLSIQTNWLVEVVCQFEDEAQGLCHFCGHGSFAVSKPETLGGIRWKVQL